jgi:hypothetical protein
MPITDSGNHPLQALVRNKGKAAPEIEGMPPLFHFQFKYNHSFANVVNGLVMREHWEKRNQLTSVVSVEQVDDDNVCIYRRINHYETILPPTYEKILINRKEMNAQSIVLAPNPDRSETVVERSVFTGDGETQMDTYAYDAQGSIDGRVEIFKRHVRNIITAMQFKKWSDEE